MPSLSRLSRQATRGVIDCQGYRQRCQPSEEGPDRQYAPGASEAKTAPAVGIWHRSETFHPFSRATSPGP